MNMRKRPVVERYHQGGGLVDLARIFERVVGVHERGLGLPEEP
jgi:hypothetical protein